MKKNLSIFLLIILSLSFIGCSKSDGKLDLNIEISETITDGKLDVEVKTNLPDSTKVSLELKNNQTDYMGVSGLIIEHGKAKTNESFSNKNEALEPGTYILSFVLSFPELQPESVKKIIGENFENINSEYILESEYGTIIQYDKEIEIK